MHVLSLPSWTNLNNSSILFEELSLFNALLPFRLTVDKITPVFLGNILLWFSKLTFPGCQKWHHYYTLEIGMTGDQNNKLALSPTRVANRGFPGGSGKEFTCQSRRQGSYLWVGKTTWRRKWPPPPVFLPGKSHGQRTCWATVHGVARESDTTQQLNSNSKIADTS